MNIDILTVYKKQQVIINMFKDDELINKDGFFFDKLNIDNNRVEFIKDLKLIYSISLEQYPYFDALDDFKNYFSFSNNNRDRIEIYFP